MVMKFTNNATTTLASGINSSVTSLTVSSGTGTLFPTLGGGDYFFCTLANSGGSIEIVKVTARSTDTFTITRGQDGTTGLAWNAGDKVELRLVAASLNDIPKLDEANTFSGINSYSNVTVTYSGTSATSGALNVGGALNITADTGIISSLVGVADTYSFVALQNKNTSGTANTSYGAYALYNNLGTVYGEIGINSSTYSYSAAGFPNNSLSTASALFVEAGSGAELVLGTYGSNGIHFVINGTSSTKDAVSIDTSNSLNLGGSYTEAAVAIGNSGTTQTLSLANGTVQTVTMTGNCTFTMPTVTAGKSFILIVSTGAGSFTGTFTSVKWPNNTAPTLTTTASRWDILTFVSDGTNWYGNSAQAYA
jgi:hypothetical protein